MTEVSRTDRGAVDGDRPDGVTGPVAGGAGRSSASTSASTTAGTATGTAAGSAGYTAARRPAYPSGAAPTAARGPRRARLTVRRVDPWSALKFSFVLSIALLIVWIVAITALYGVLSSMGVFDKVNQFLDELTSGSFTITLTASKVIGWAALLGAINAILFTALCTLGAFIYNLCASLAGGLEITLAERE